MKEQKQGWSQAHLFDHRVAWYPSSAPATSPEEISIHLLTEGGCASWSFVFFVFCWHFDFPSSLPWDAISWISCQFIGASRILLSQYAPTGLSIMCMETPTIEAVTQFHRRCTALDALKLEAITSPSEAVSRLGRSWFSWILVKDSLFLQFQCQKNMTDMTDMTDAWPNGTEPSSWRCMCSNAACCLLVAMLNAQCSMIPNIINIHKNPQDVCFHDSCNHSCKFLIHCKFLFHVLIVLACVSSGGILAEHPKSIGNHCIATAVYPTAPETPQQLWRVDRLSLWHISLCSWPSTWTCWHRPRCFGHWPTVLASTTFTAEFGHFGRDSADKKLDAMAHLWFMASHCIWISQSPHFQGWDRCGAAAFQCWRFPGKLQVWWVDRVPGKTRIATNTEIYRCYLAAFAEIQRILLFSISNTCCGLDLQSWGRHDTAGQKRIVSHKGTRDERTLTKSLGSIGAIPPKCVSSSVPGYVCTIRI